MVLDRQPFEALARFSSEHRRAIVGEHRARKASLLEALAEPVDEALRVLVVEVPLRVAAHARAVVDETEEHRRAPLAGAREHLALAVVEVGVPEPVHVTDFERATLARHEALLALVTSRLALLAEAVVLHEPADRRVRRQHAELRPLSPQRVEVVVHELERPPRMLAPQRADHLRHGRRHAGMRARVARHLPLKRADRLVLALRRVVPALDCLRAEAHRLPRRRVPPLLRGKRDQARAQIPRLGRRAQQCRDDPESKSRPSHARRGVRLVAHSRLARPRQFPRGLRSTP